MKILVAFRETSHIDLAHGNVIRTLRGGGGGEGSAAGTFVCERSIGC